MSASFAFYIHHHGSGHLMRALSIASRLKDDRVTFIGSDLARYEGIIPKDIHCIHLTGDVADAEDSYADLNRLSFLHYVPMNVEKVARRAAAITATLHALFPAILIVDVSVEVTMLATLCAVPTVVIRQNGDRDDVPHLHAYEAGQLIIAPSPASLMNKSTQSWVNEKTYFSGGFSKYSGKSADEVAGNAIGILVGSGGTSIDGNVVNAIAKQCPDQTIHVIGKVSATAFIQAENVILHGQLDEPLPVLSECDIIVGNAGHNTVMEMADLDKKFICIPEERPFQEQFLKAKLLEENEIAIVIQPEQLADADWKLVMNRAEHLPENRWQGVISDTALEDIAAKLHKVWDYNFGPKTPTV